LGVLEASKDFRLDAACLSITVGDSKFCSKELAGQFFFNGKPTSEKVQAGRIVHHFVQVQL
jgi:hypothetical protein